jgi:hypothetical protein
MNPLPNPQDIFALYTNHASQRNTRIIVGAEPQRRAQKGFARGLIPTVVSLSRLVHTLA